MRICKLCKRENKQKRTKNQICEHCHKGRIQTWNKCLICKKLFHPDKLNQKLCSRKCKDESQSKNGTSKKGKKYPHLQRARIGTCLICNKEFRAVKDFKHKKQKYCSRECWSKRNPPKEKICRYCGKEYTTYERNTKTYCSKDCRDMDYRKRFKGDKSWLWKGGKTKESKVRRTRKAYREWRTSVFKRDNYLCVKCKVKKKYIQAHHKKSVSEYPELIYEISNGETLCLDCHQKKHPELRINIKKRMTINSSL